MMISHNEHKCNTSPILTGNLPQLKGECELNRHMISLTFMLCYGELLLNQGVTGFK